MGKDKEKIKTKASKEPMRWAETEEAPVARGPSEEGNDFDVRMREEPDGMKAAEKIAKVIKERGFCLVEANAPLELLSAATDEAQQLWEDGHFQPPFRVGDHRAMLEAEIWQQALADEEKVFWIKDGDPKIRHLTNALKLLAKNISDFAGGLSQLLKRDVGVEFDRHGHTMLSCYTGDRQYTPHVDNPCGDEEDDKALPDNGMRLTCIYFVNVHWDPSNGGLDGGLDLHLTDPSSKPESLAEARRAPRIRIAPHADTLVIFRSDRMVHQVIKTAGPDRWFAMTLWTLQHSAMEAMTRKLLRMKQQAAGVEKDSDEED